MVAKIAVFAAAFVYKAFLYRLGVNWFSPDGNTRRHRATLRTTMWLVLLFTVLEVVAAALWLLPMFALGVAALHLVLFLFIFGEYFGLGIKRTLGLAVMQWVGMGLFALLLRFVPALS